MRGLPAVAGVLLATVAMAQDPPLPALHPIQASESQAVRVALVDSGVNYQLEAINSRLARRNDGSLIGYDFWDMDELPFDANPDAHGNVQRHGTRTASVLLREAPFVKLVPYRYPRPDMQRMQELVEHAAEHDVRIVGLSLGGNLQTEWTAFEVAAREHTDMLFIISAGNNGRDIDKTPVYPAALDLPNALVVTSANDFALLAQGSNWGRRSVDYMVPAEFVSVIRFSAPDYLRDLETGASRTLMDAVRFSGAARRVAIVFARDTRMRTAFDAEAFGRGNTRTRAWLTDSVWLTLALQDRDIALSHELFHVLSNSGTHVRTPGNLMLNRTTGDNRTLEPGQCELARHHSLDAGLTYQGK